VPTFRRLEERPVFSPLFALRERAAARWRYPERRAAFEAIRARRMGERCFVLGTAPSLAGHDLDRLDGEAYFACNMAERLPWMQGRTHPYYIAADMAVPEKYDGGRPGLSARQFFFARKLAPRLDPGFVAGNDVFLFAPAKGGIGVRGLTPEPWVSLGWGHTILISAVQMAWAIGYREIYVMGCDLDYSGPAPYAYGTIGAEPARSGDDEMRIVTNAQFGILHRAIAAQGGTLANAGIGGRLETLPRVDYDGLFRAV